MFAALSKYIKTATAWLTRVIRQPRDELNRWQRTVRFGYDLMRYGGEQLQHDRASQMAAALAFRSLFALLPVLVVTTIVVKGLKGTDALLVLTRDVFRTAGLNTIRLIPADGTDTDLAQPSISLAEWLEGLLSQAFQINLSAVGWIGAAVIIYAAISLMVTIENSFNSVFRAPEGRPWVRRIPLYWFVLTIGPVAAGVIWFLKGLFTHSIADLIPWATGQAIIGVGWNVFLIWLFMAAVYIYIPNTKVAIRPALVGALVASILFEIGQRFLGVYLQNAFAISHLYGSLGLVPLFMFWIYLMWMVVLFGLELSATLQRLRGRDLDDIRQHEADNNGMFDPVSIVNIMEVVARDFKAGKVSAAQQVAEEIAISERLVKTMLSRLVDEGILHRIDRDDATFSLARPPEQIELNELLEISYELIDFHPNSTFVKTMRETQRGLIGHTTLAAQPL